MIRGLAGRAALRAPIAGRDVDLAAEDRLDALLLRLIVEDDRREHVAVLGDRERRHLQARRLLQQLVDAAGAVEQRIFGVQVQVDEITHGPGQLWARSAYSHSIVDGGFELMSNTTRLMPFTSLTTRDEIVARSSCGRRAQSAVMPSLLSTARIAMVDS